MFDRMREREQAPYREMLNLRETFGTLDLKRMNIRTCSIHRGGETEKNKEDDRGKTFIHSGSTKSI